MRGDRRRHPGVADAVSRHGDHWVVALDTRSNATNRRTGDRVRREDVERREAAVMASWGGLEARARNLLVLRIAER